MRSEEILSREVGRDAYGGPTNGDVNFESHVPRDCRLRVVSYLRPSELYCLYALTSRQCRDDSECDSLPQMEWGEVFCGHGPQSARSDRAKNESEDKRGRETESQVSVDDALRRWSHWSFRRAFRPSGRRRRLRLIGHWSLRHPDASYEELNALTESAILHGVTVLDASLPPRLPRSERTVPRAIFWALSGMLPMLREIDLSNLYSGPMTEESVISELACFRHETTPNLEVVRWNNRVGGCHFLVRCNELKTLRNLREVCFDNLMADSRYDGCFDAVTYRFLMECSSFELRPERHILLKCCANLERVSLLRTMYYDQESRKSQPLSQAALVKFVRYVPTLKYFRSDLNEENVRMLRIERPDLEFETE